MESFHGGTLIALGVLMATIWIEKDMEGQFVMVDAQDAWDEATGSKRFRGRDALAALAKKQRWEDIRTILEATIVRAKGGDPSHRGSTGLTEGEAYGELVQALRRQGLDIDASGRLVAIGLGEVAGKEQVGHFEMLLKEMLFETTRNHFRQAMSALGRDEWESANGQTRTFLDSLCEEIVARLLRFVPGEPPKGGAARKHLQETGFLDDDEADLLRSLIKVLHGRGSHPGTSAKNDSTRRMLMASATGSYYIERLMAKEDIERKDRRWMEALAEDVLEGIGTSSMLGEYQSIDFDIAHVAGETIVFESSESTYANEHPLGEAFLSELEAAMARGYMDFAIVLTDRGIDTAATHLERVSEGVFIRAASIAVVDLRRDAPDEARVRIATARDELEKAIERTRQLNREREAKGLDLMEVLRAAADRDKGA